MLMLILAALAASPAAAREPAFDEWQAVQESLSCIHPRMRASWLAERGYDNSEYTTFRKPDSNGLRCIGRWPLGPSWELCGRDTFLYLGSGSGVRILSIADSTNPRQLGQIAARGLINQLVVQDTLLYVACGPWGAQVYSVADPANPRELGSMDATIGDLAVLDTLCYCLGPSNDSFRIYNVADPTAPMQLSVVRDSGQVVVVGNGHAFCGGRWGMNVYNVANPQSPVRVASRGGTYYAMQVRRNLLFCTGTQSDHLTILDISSLPSVSVVGQLGGYGGEGLYVAESYAFLSCNYEHTAMFVIDVSDSAHPVLRDSLDPEGTTEYDPYAPPASGYCHLADDHGGLVVVDIHDVNSIAEVWSGYKADLALDVAVDAERAYVATERAGLQIVDVTDPSVPFSLGLYDVVGSKVTHSATARDSFAFMGLSAQPGRKHLLVLDVLDPCQPTLVAQESCTNWPEDMVLRDSLLYVAEQYVFQVYNVARPREPELVGSCGGDGVAIEVQDSFAYTAAGATRITNIARPDSPYVVATISGHGAGGIAVRDTFLYIPAGYDTVWVYSVSEPAAPYLVGITPMPCHLWDIALADSVAAVATVRGLDLLSLANPASPVRLGGLTTPYGPRRVVWSEPYFYAAMWDAGVGIYAVESVGVSEPAMPEARPRVLAVRPNPTRGRLEVQLAGGGLGEVRVWDAAGRCVVRQQVRGWQENVFLNLTDQKGGVYFIENCSPGRAGTVKVVKQ